MKKIMTIVGTRPELIRLSEIIKKLDLYTNHIFVHTGQNFTLKLHDQFFEDMNIRKPNYQLNTKERLTGIEFVGKMFIDINTILEKEKPDAVLILGDTNSGLSAYICKSKNIPVFHMEAGNRCYSDEVPEEANRKIIDSLSTYLLPYTQRSREQLLLEGYKPQNIIVTGNPILEVIHSHEHIIKKTKYDKYILATIHRNENVTDKIKLKNIMSALNVISKKNKIILSMHPKLKSMIEKYNIHIAFDIKQHEPFSFNEFLGLEENADCVITDSGTVPEECTIFKTPCVLVRNSTERPELLENNSMILSGTNKDDIINAFETAIKIFPNEYIPADYVDTNISDKIVKILLRCTK